MAGLQQGQFVEFTHDDARLENLLPTAGPTRTEAGWVSEEHPDGTASIWLRGPYPRMVRVPSEYATPTDGPSPDTLPDYWKQQIGIIASMDHTAAVEDAKDRMVALWEKLDKTAAGTDALQVGDRVILSDPDPESVKQDELYARMQGSPGEIMEGPLSMEDAGLGPGPYYHLRTEDGEWALVMSHEVTLDKTAVSKIASTGNMIVAINHDFDDEDREYAQDDLEELVGAGQQDPDGIWNYEITNIRVTPSEIEVNLRVHTHSYESGGIDDEIAYNVFDLVESMSNHYGDIDTPQVIDANMESWGKVSVGGLRTVEEAPIGTRVSRKPSWLNRSRSNGTVIDVEGSGANGKLTVEMDDGSIEGPTYPASFELEDEQSGSDFYTMPDPNPPMDAERNQAWEDRDKWLETGQLPPRRSSKQSDAYQDPAGDYAGAEQLAPADQQQQFNEDARARLERLNGELTQVEQDLDDHHAAKDWDRYDEARARYNDIDDELQALEEALGIGKQGSTKTAGTYEVWLEGPQVAVLMGEFTAGGSQQFQNIYSGDTITCLDGNAEPFSDSVKLTFEMPEGEENDLDSLMESVEYEYKNNVMMDTDQIEFGDAQKIDEDGEGYDWDYEARQRQGSNKEGGNPNPNVGSEWRATGYQDAQAGADFIGYEDMVAEMVAEGDISGPEEFSKRDHAQYIQGIRDYWNNAEEQGRSRGMNAEQYHEHQQQGGDWVWRGDLPGDRMASRKQSKAIPFRFPESELGRAMSVIQDENGHLLDAMEQDEEDPDAYVCMQCGYMLNYGTSLFEPDAWRADGELGEPCPNAYDPTAATSESPETSPDRRGRPNDYSRAYAAMRRKAQPTNTQPPPPAENQGDPNRQRYEALYSDLNEEFAADPAVGQELIESATQKAWDVAQTDPMAATDDETLKEHARFFLGQQDQATAMVYASLFREGIRCPACQDSLVRRPDNPMLFQCKQGHVSTPEIKGIPGATREGSRKLLARLRREIRTGKLVAGLGLTDEAYRAEQQLNLEASTPDFTDELGQVVRTMEAPDGRSVLFMTDTGFYGKAYMSDRHADARLQIEDANEQEFNLLNEAPKHGRRRGGQGKGRGGRTAIHRSNGESYYETGQRDSDDGVPMMSFEEFAQSEVDDEEAYDEWLAGWRDNEGIGGGPDGSLGDDYDARGNVKDIDDFISKGRFGGRTAAWDPWQDLPYDIARRAEREGWSDRDVQVFANTYEWYLTEYPDDAEYLALEAVERKRQDSPDKMREEGWGEGGMHPTARRVNSSHKRARGRRRMAVSQNLPDERTIEFWLNRVAERGHEIDANSLVSHQGNSIMDAYMHARCKVCGADVVIDERRGHGDAVNLDCPVSYQNFGPRSASHRTAQGNDLQVDIDYADDEYYQETDDAETYGVIATVRDSQGNEVGQLLVQVENSRLEGVFDSKGNPINPGPLGDSPSEDEIEEYARNYFAHHGTYQPRLGSKVAADIGEGDRVRVRETGEEAEVEEVEGGIAYLYEYDQETGTEINDEYPLEALELVEKAEREPEIDTSGMTFRYQPGDTVYCTYYDLYLFGPREPLTVLEQVGTEAPMRNEDGFEVMDEDEAGNWIPRFGPAPGYLVQSKSGVKEKVAEEHLTDKPAKRKRRTREEIDRENFVMYD